MLPFIHLALVLAWQHPSSEVGDGEGLRRDLEERGLTVGLHTATDNSVVLRGGRTPGAAAVRSLLDVPIDLDLERLVRWPGASVHLGVQVFGGLPILDATGEFSPLSNIDAQPFVALAFAWFEQVLLHGRLRLAIGRMDANDEFASPVKSPLPLRIRGRRVFLNSSMGFSPTMLRFASYPQQSLGAVVVGRPSQAMSISVGVFDAVLYPSPLSSFERPAEIPFSSVSLVAQIEPAWRVGPRGLRGSVTIGGWAVVGSPCDGCPAEPTGGPYLVFDQNLWREPGARRQGLTMFAQYGWADPSQSAVEHHVGGGLGWAGSIPTRDDDVVGVGASWLALARSQRPPGAAAHETAIEVFYRLQLFPWASAEPNLQLILNPAGVEADALVATVRLGIDL